jgi:hypothetical protein
MVFLPTFFNTTGIYVGKEVTSVVLRVLRGEDDVSSINDTLIVLIPKVERADDLGQYRPISLCNVIYKIASKAVANRLKLILPEIIVEEQSAFVPDRLITDDIIIAYECLHSMKQKKARDFRCCAPKHDMQKGNDQVEFVGLISQSPSDPNGSDGPTLTRALIGGAPARS